MKQLHGLLHVFIWGCSPGGSMLHRMQIQQPGAAQTAQAWLSERGKITHIVQVQLSLVQNVASHVSTYAARHSPPKSPKHFTSGAGHNVELSDTVHHIAKMYAKGAPWPHE